MPGLFVDTGLTTFLPGMTSKHDPLFFTSQVAGITGTSHQAQLNTFSIVLHNELYNN
jgi:hypothetical protein